jgi:DNA polymerase III delta' subunit
VYSEKIQAQDFVVRILKSHIQKDRVANTYLLTGDKQSGKDEVALAMAASLNCEKKRYFGECECNSCHKIAEGNHPDVHIVGKDAKARSIKIEEVRDTLSAASLKTYEGKMKIFIVQDAGRLTPDASNAFLKTLEEPPEQTVFILTVENRAYLLETILSRCFELSLKPLTKEMSGGAILMGIQDYVRNRNWEDLTDEYAGTSRDEVKGFFESLLYFLHGQLQKNPSEAYLQAVESVLEAKDSLDGNVNQKLALSRLAMKLRRNLADAGNQKVSDAFRGKSV